MLLRIPINPHPKDTVTVWGKIFEFVDKLEISQAVCIGKTAEESLINLKKSMLEQDIHWNILSWECSFTSVDNKIIN